MPKTASRYLNFIAGKWIESRTGKWSEDRNPADDGDVLGEVPKSDAGDVDAAVKAAQKAFRTWRLVPAPKRGEIMGRAAAILKGRVEAGETFRSPGFAPGLPRRAASKRRPSHG